MKRFLLFFFLALTLGTVGASADSFTIEFKTGDTSTGNTKVENSTLPSNTSVISAGSEYLSSFSNCSNLYQAGYAGLRVGTSSKNGSITLNFSEKGRVKPSKITAFVAGSTNTTKLTVNGEEISISKLVTKLDHKDDASLLTAYELKTLPQILDSIAVAKTAGKIAYLHSITVEYSTAKDEVSPVFGPTTVEEQDMAELTVEPADFFAGVSNLTFTSSDADVAEVDEGYLMGYACGTTDITASWEEGEKYAAGSTTFTVSVKQAGAPAAPVFSEPDGSVFPVADGLIFTISGAGTIYYGEGTTKEDATTEYIEGIIREEPGVYHFVAYSKVGELESELATVTYSIVKPTPEFGFAKSEYTAMMGGSAQALTNEADLPYTLTTSNAAVAAVSPVDGKAIWMLAPGTATITASFAGNADYEAVTSSYELTITEEKGEPEVKVVKFDFTLADENGIYGMTPQTGNSQIYNETSSPNGVKFYEGEVEIQTSKGSGAGTRLWKATNGYEFRIMKNSSITISVPEGCYLNSIEIVKSGNNGFGSWAYASGANVSSVTLSNNTNATYIQTITVTYTAPGASPSHSHVAIDFEGDREVLVDDVTSIAKAAVAADATDAVHYTIFGVEDFDIEEGEGDMLDVMVMTKGEYELVAYVEPSDVFYPAIVKTPLYVRGFICPEKLYMVGHFYNSYYNLNNAVEMERVGKVFTAKDVLIGGNKDVEDGDHGFVFVTHLPAVATAPAAAGMMRAAAHESDWSDLTEGHVFDADGRKEASAVTAQSDITPMVGKEGAGYYTVSMDFTDPENHEMNAEHSVTTGVESIAVGSATDTETFYDLSGKRVSAPASGVYIRMIGGRAEKVVRR